MSPLDLHRPNCALLRQVSRILAPIIQPRLSGLASRQLICRRRGMTVSPTAAAKPAGAGTFGIISVRD